ncbi:hypothetical protein BOTBODRAFT_109811 [Botryobasidium botryosum FD-172 SS1]|uniref:DUF6593 domain-containing protein n=1 Tax=Botryobasidium botryosum (strain FD-172 SS1) TaxID=930990 RepID=A0A067MG53_BOTB1|nr:hypothetical protein BOTBODRAFT_109811 [Botryobasidium botryosum FD-172 SS1]
MSGDREILNWTSNDPRQSLLYNAWGILYRLSTEQSGGKHTTTIWRAIRQNREDRVARLEWNPNGGLGRAILGRTIIPMADLVRSDTPHSRSSYRAFNGPDGIPYRWRASSTSSDLLLQDPSGSVIALFRPVRGARSSLGDVTGELHIYPNSGNGTVQHPPMMDMVVTTAMLNRMVTQYAL